MTVPPRSFPTLRAVLPAVLLAVVLALLSPVAPARAAGSGHLCDGYVPCAKDGYRHFGYKQHNDTMWWRMYTGHNCTNYVAYRLVKRGMSPERPWDGTGMAYNWGRANRRITDDTPRVGAVAWWNAGDGGVGSSGHVAYVQQVRSRRKIVVSEDSWGGDFDWRVITKASGRWPTGFVHFLDEELEVVRAPAVVGTPQVGVPLTADPGQWRPSATYALQWLADGTPIDGATGTTFTPSTDLVGARLSVRVSASAKGYGPASATSAASEAVRPGEMTVTEQPALTGTPRVDEVLTLDPGASAPAPDSRVVRWFADGTRIDGASGVQLRLGQELIDQRITAVVTSRREGYRKLQATTPATAPVEAGRIQVSEPFSLTGRARLGRGLSVRPGAFTPEDAEVTYTWLRDGEPIEGATGLSYQPVVADVGHQLAVRVGLRRTGYRNHVVELAAATPVTTKPRLRLRTVGRVHRAVVRVRVKAPGVADPAGQATVRLGRRHRVRGDVVDGVMRVVLRRLPAGNRLVRVRYHGTDVVLPARRRGRVQIRR